MYLSYDFIPSPFAFFLLHSVVFAGFCALVSLC